MAGETNPNQPINGQELEGCDSEITSYLRAFAELIFDAWKEQYSSSVKSEITLVQMNKNRSDDLTT